MLSVVNILVKCVVWTQHFDPISRAQHHFENPLANSLDALLCVRCCTLRGWGVHLDPVHPIRPNALSYWHLVWWLHNGPQLLPTDLTQAHHRNSVSALRIPIWWVRLATDDFQMTLNDRQQFDWLSYTVHHSLRTNWNRSWLANVNCTIQ